MTNTLAPAPVFHNGVRVTSMSDLHIVCCEQLLERLGLRDTPVAYQWAQDRVDDGTDAEATIGDYFSYVRAVVGS